MNWSYQETYTVWTVWGFGIVRKHGRGWFHNEATIYIGPIRIVLTGELAESDDLR